MARKMRQRRKAKRENATIARNGFGAKINGEFAEKELEMYECITNSAVNKPKEDKHKLRPDISIAWQAWDLTISPFEMPSTERSLVSPSFSLIATNIVKKYKMVEINNDIPLKAERANSM